MAATVTGILLTGVHGSRPSSGVSAGTLYSCTTHSLVYQTTDTGATWVTWATLGTGTSTTTIANDTLWAAAGDLVQATGNDAAAVLSAGASGKVLQAAGAAAANAWKYPPSYEYDYVEYTSPVNITATTEATSNTIVTGNSITYDGSTIIIVECFMPYLTAAAGNTSAQLVLFDAAGGGAAASIGIFGLETQEGASNNQRQMVVVRRRLTPSNAAHIYSLRGHTSTGTAVAGAGAGGSGAYMPGFIRQIKVSGGA